ncbi:MAG: 1-acyl-sn-glycerol-3-phosphate acyltransferase [Myxococcales bacterium]|nr:1-acyl-sn-glycerol-3-phosphate acyltransferase [Myxococcales bacterium]
MGDDDALGRARRDRAAIARQVRRRVGAGAAHRRADDAARIDGYLDELALGYRGWARRAATAALRPLLGAVYTPPGDALDALDALDDRLELTGEVAALTAAARARALILAPTHGANLDALAVGVALVRLGLPPCAYPVGEHLFRNPVVGALMRAVGGFRIERGRTSPRYLAVVTAYLAALIERGVPLVVFPGGTRNRAGTVDARLRLGLIAAATRAAAAAGRPAVVVPLTINHQLVLEAAHLVDYHLRGRGHERVVGDELFVPGRLTATARRLRALDQRTVLGVGAPLAAAGRATPAALAGALVTAYRAGAVFLDTHVLGRALDELRVAAGGPVQPQVAAGAPRRWPRAEVERAVAAVAALIARHPTDGRRWRPHRDPAAIVAGALAAWRAGHPAPIAQATGTSIALIDPRLAWFYGNRTRHVGAPAPGTG